MADRKTASESPRFTIATIEKGIDKLRSCTKDLEGLGSSKVRYNHQSVQDIARDIEATLINVFGKDSQEYEDNRLLLFPPRLLNMNRTERQETFPERITHTVERLEELIEGLKGKREDPEADQRVEQSGATSLVKSSANTRQVEDAQGVDQLDAPSPAKQYEVALSFAGEQREYVKQVATALRSREIAVFYDDFERVPLWGKNLGEEFHKVFEHEAVLAVMFISKEYVEKAWPQHERQSILSRMIQEKGEYILPVRFDDTPVPGLPTSIGYQRADDHSPEELAAMIAEKLGLKPQAMTVGAVGSDSRKFLGTVAGGIIGAVFSAHLVIAAPAGTFFADNRDPTIFLFFFIGSFLGFLLGRSSGKRGGTGPRALPT